MTFQSYSGISVEITDIGLRLYAESKAGRFALGGEERIIRFSDVEAINLQPPAGLKNGLIVISDSYLRTELAFLKKNLTEAKQCFDELASKFPDAIGVQVNTALWNSKRQVKATLNEMNRTEAITSNSEIQDAKDLKVSSFEETRGKNLWNTRDISLYETTIASRTFTGKIKKEYPLSDIKHISYVEPKGADVGSVSVIDDTNVTHKLSSTVQRHHYEDLCNQLAKNPATAHISTGLSERSGFKVSAINQEFIGSMKAESLLNRLNTDTKERIGGSGGSEVKVYKTFISQNGINRFFDEYVTAELIVDGQIQVTHRPTLTRMALTSALPGPALAWGLALAKQKQHDSRRVIFTCTHPDWSISLNVDPNEVANAKALTMRINSICERISDSK